MSCRRCLLPRSYAARLTAGSARAAVTAPGSCVCVFYVLTPPLVQVAGYSGLLLAAPTVLYEVIAYVVPGLTKSERKFLAPIVFGSSILFYLG